MSPRVHGVVVSRSVLPEQGLPDRPPRSPARRVVDPHRVFQAAQMYPHSSEMIAHEAGITGHLRRV